MKYIDADLLKSKLKDVATEFKTGNYYLDNSEQAVGYENALIDFEQLVDSLQQEQPNDICAEIKEYYGEELAFEDERTKAAYHFFSAGKAFELKEYEEERKKHITDLLDNFQKGMNAGYEKAISELKNKEFLNESEQVFVDLVTERMLKEGPIPTLKGKQKAEFEKEFNRFKQITGMINFPAHMEIYKRIILWFMAWGADNLPNLGKPIDPGRMDIQQEQPEVNFEKELKNERAKLLDAFGPMNGEQSLAIRNFAHHFYELGQIEMRHRITNPEYNAKVVEQLKSEYPARKED